MTATTQRVQFTVPDTAPVIQKTPDTTNQKKNRVARTMAARCRFRYNVVTRMMPRITCVPT